MANEGISRIAVIIPAYNPDTKLLSLIEQLITSGFECIVVVDDGSEKSRTAYFDDAKSKYGCTILRHGVNMGKGRALKTAFNFLLTNRPELCGAVAVEADGQYTAMDTVRCAEALLKNPDCLVMGCRNFKSSAIPKRNKTGNVLTCRVLKLFTGISSADTLTGLRAISYPLMKKMLEVKGERYEYEMNMLVETKALGVNLFEVPIEAIYVKNNSSSHFGALKDSMKIYSVFSKMILCSLFATAVDLAVFAICIGLFKEKSPGFYIFISTAIARLLSLSLSTALNRKTLFKNSSGKNSVLVGLRYLLVALAMLILSACGVWALAKLVNIGEVFLKVIVDVLIFFLSFPIRREWVFTGKTKKTKQ
ncbi:MAG: bifunctional glycosyltransferase family 2/GtrA family protein [Oscillospiraceae bacterium]